LLNFGLGPEQTRFTFKEIASMWNMSKENVRLIFKKAFQKLKNDFTFRQMDPDYLDTIECLNLSLRPYNCLKNAGIYTMEHLLDLDELELINVKGLGTKSLQELKEAIRKYEIQKESRQSVITTKMSILEEMQELEMRKKELELENQQLDYKLFAARKRYEEFKKSELSRRK